MYKNKRILGLITARGGSKGLPGKNIKPLCGKPLIGWTVQSALASRCLDSVCVSTDDEAIARVARRYGASVPFLRPAKLASDTASSLDVILHAVSFYEKAGETFDYLLLLEPTSPLRLPGDIDAAIKRLVDRAPAAESLVSVGRIEQLHPFAMKSIDQRGYMRPFIRTPLASARRQALPPVYYPFGLIYLSSIDSLRRRRTFYHTRTIPYVIDRSQQCEIDDALDFKIAGYLLRSMVREGKLRRR